MIQLISEITQKAFLSRTETEILEKAVYLIPKDKIKKFSYLLFCDSYKFNTNGKTSITLPMCIFYIKSILREQAQILAKNEFESIISNSDECVGDGLMNKLVRNHFKKMVGNELCDIVIYD